MSLQVSVQNGTNAGRKAPLKPRAEDWRCGNCGRHNRHYWTVCPSCGERRK